MLGTLPLESATYHGTRVPHRQYGRPYLLQEVSLRKDTSNKAGDQRLPHVRGVNCTCCSRIAPSSPAALLASRCCAAPSSAAAAPRATSGVRRMERVSAGTTCRVFVCCVCCVFSMCVCGTCCAVCVIVYHFACATVDHIVRGHPLHTARNEQTHIHKQTTALPPVLRPPTLSVHSCCVRVVNRRL